MLKESLSSRKVEKHLYYLKNRMKISKRTKKYAQNHPEQCRKYSKKWRLNHPEYGKNYNLKHSSQRKSRARKWAIVHPERIKDIQKKYCKTHREKLNLKNKKYRGKHPERAREYERKNRFKHPEIERKHRAKRRKLGFVPFNEPFENSEGHHIDFECVIYIPEQFHTSIPHNVWTGHNMELINSKAFEYLSMDKFGKPLNRTVPMI